MALWETNAVEVASGPFCSICIFVIKQILQRHQKFPVLFSNCGNWTCRGCPWNSSTLGCVWGTHMQQTVCYYDLAIFKTSNRECFLENERGVQLRNNRNIQRHFSPFLILHKIPTCGFTQAVTIPTPNACCVQPLVRPLGT